MWNMYYAILVLSVWLSYPTVISTEEVNSPLGHGLPFGGHKPPSVQVEEYTVDNAPDPRTFFENHVKDSKAAIFRGAMKDTDAFTLWTDEYLRKNFGEMEVRLEKKMDETFLPPIGETYIGRDTMHHFLDTYHQDVADTYVVSDLPSVMYHDVGVAPSFGACGQMSRHIVEIDIWWSGGNTKSLIHKDAYNQMNCLINGTKYWKLIEYKYEKNLYKYPEPEYEIGGFSTVDPEAVDLTKHPEVANIEWSNLTINAGDCLFLPKSYYHQVNSVGTNNLAVSILFGRFDGKESLNFSDCTDDTDYKRLRRLSEFDVQWQWNGTGMMPMGRSDLEDDYRATLLYYTKEAEKNATTLKGHYLRDIFANRSSDFDHFNESHAANYTKALEAIDENKDGVISEEEVRAMNAHDLRIVANEVERYEPSSNYTYEYSVISFDVVYPLLKRVLSENEILERENWIVQYKTLGGTVQKANEIFSRLAGEAKELISKKITKANVAYALENWIYYWAPEYSDNAVRGRPSIGDTDERTTPGEIHSDSLRQEL